MNQEVLVLNSDYEPLNVCNVRRAIVLVYLGKADILHTDEDRSAATVDGSFITPSVVKLRGHVKRPLPELKLSRRTIFARDNYVCQYCGSTTKDLTIDHVIPKRAGGGASWDNLVTCCRTVQHEEKRQAGAPDRHETGAYAPPSQIYAVYQPDQVPDGSQKRSVARLPAHLRRPAGVALTVRLRGVCQSVFGVRYWIFGEASSEYPIPNTEHPFLLQLLPSFACLYSLPAISLPDT